MCLRTLQTATCTSFMRHNEEISLTSSQKEFSCSDPSHIFRLHSKICIWRKKTSNKKNIYYEQGHLKVKGVSVKMTEYGCTVEVESVLRLRPLLNKERDDDIILKEQNAVGRNGPPTVVLNQTSSPSMSTETEYHFNHILPDDTSQDKIYFKLGLPIATSAMDSLKLAMSNHVRDTSKSHLLICMGVSNSGKTYTCFGGNGTTVSKRRNAQDGIVPRLVDSLFSQSRHHHGNRDGGSKDFFTVQISMIQVTQVKGKESHACQIQDLLAAPSPSSSSTQDKNKSPPKRNKSVLSMVANFERTVTSQVISPLSKLGVSGVSSTEFKELDMDDLNPCFKSCRDISEAREVFQTGLTASRKAARGQKNHHLIITIQPIFDGKYYGDKIAIIDMAGLEKSKRSHHHNNRGKDSVPNANQAANGAVLHCLRTLIYNTNVKSGKKGCLDIMCPDDDDVVSEISNVSQTYNKHRAHHQRNRLKPVPFRQHQVTMAMKSLLTSKSSAKVTLLLAAYPGHVDYFEKKSLLQDIELLCGSNLLSSNAVAETGSEEAEEEEEVKSQVSIDDESIDQDPIPIRQAPQRSLSINKRTKHLGKVSSLGLTKAPTAPVRANSLDDDDDEKLSMPPAYAPNSRREPPKAYSRWLARPSAPPEDVEPTIEKSLPGKPNTISDFPGVKLPTKSIESSPIVERMKTDAVLPSSTFGGPSAKPPPSSDEMSWVSQDKGQSTSKAHGKGKYVDTKLPLQPSSVANIKPSQNNQSRKSPQETKSMLQQKEAINVFERKQVQNAIHGSYVSMPPKQLNANPLSYPRERHQMEISQSSWKAEQLESNFHQGQVPESSTTIPQQTPQMNRLSRKRKDSPAFDECESNPRKKKDDQDHEDLTQKLKLLEVRLNETIQQKRILESRCQELEKENRFLKSTKRGDDGKYLPSNLTEQEEQEYQQSRKIRLEEQKIIKEPLMRHFENVNKVYDIKNQWCMSQKAHFGLRFPGNFQRAPELNERDKAQQEEEERLEGNASVKSMRNTRYERKIAPRNALPEEQISRSSKRQAWRGGSLGGGT